MDNSIIGKTNGANSSEFWLFKVFVIVGGAVVAVGVTAGVLTPEHAEQATKLIDSFVSWSGAGVALYTACRTLIKAVLAYNQQFEEGQDAPE